MFIVLHIYFILEHIDTSQTVSTFRLDAFIMNVLVPAHILRVTYNHGITLLNYYTGMYTSIHQLIRH